MEVMGLMLGEFVDEYTVQVIDVFAMPQSGTTVTVESVDHVFQTKMVDMLKQTGRYAQSLVFYPTYWLITHQTRNGRRMVPLPSWIWLLVIKCGHQYTTGDLEVPDRSIDIKRTP